jgi:hypothetical protein
MKVETMLRASLLGLPLLMTCGLALAQQKTPYDSTFTITESATLVNHFANEAADPKQVDLVFKEGNTIAEVLEGLKAKGFAIDYKKESVPPTMTLLTLPKSTRIDDVLREILEPWNLSLYHTPLGHWVVHADKTKAPKILDSES